MNSEDARLLPLNCPKCGRAMRFVDANSPTRSVVKTKQPAEPTFFVFDCPDHGLHYVGGSTPLTAGPPPRTARGGGMTTTSQAAPEACGTDSRRGQSERFGEWSGTAVITHIVRGGQ
jgi:hypothetical protein